MATEIKYQYPCELKIGDTIRTKDGRKRVIQDLTGRYILFEDGSAFGYRHPDLESIIRESKRKKKSEVETPKDEEVSEETDAQEE